MPADSVTIKAARVHTLYAAKNLLATAISRAESDDSDASDALVVAVLRVLDGYEAVAQLPDAHEIAGEPDKPIPFRPVR